MSLFFFSLSGQLSKKKLYIFHSLVWKELRHVQVVFRVDRSAAEISTRIFGNEQEKSSAANTKKLHSQAKLVKAKCQGGIVTPVFLPTCF